jgi:hypothetical protein
LECFINKLDYCQPLDEFVNVLLLHVFFLSLS